MLKKIFISYLFSVLCFCAQFKSQRFEILAQDIQNTDDIVIANGNVVVFSQSYYLNAQKVLYDKVNKTFELFGDVLILKDNDIQTKGQYAYLNVLDNTLEQNDFFLFENKNDVWLKSDKISKKKKKIRLKNTVISSCDCVDPAWSIKTTSSSYDTKTKWINTYNSRLYFKNIPIFYTPYLGFSINRTRTSGFLLPMGGYSKNDGIYYSQSLFLAPSYDYDFEIVPQIRSKRGYGTYAYFRYADSLYSTLKLKAGFFKEKDRYQKEFLLQNDMHYGWDINYEREKLFSSKDNQDGLYTSITSLNDIEYKTLENDDDIKSVEKKVESKINYFYNTPKYYTGIYARFYIDTQEKSNEKTLQKLPEINFHLYNKETFLRNLMYSLDVNYFNYYRQKGLNADIYKVSLPIYYSKYFFNNYLYASIDNEVNISKYNYFYSNNTFKNALLSQNKLSFSLATDLIKSYEDYLHTMNLDIKYSYPKNIKKTGDLYKITNNDKRLAYFPFSDNQKNIKLSFNQSLYKNFKQIINHKLSQSIIYDKNDKLEFQNLSNFIKFNHKYGNISGNMIYNISDNSFIEKNISTNFKYKDLSFDFGYYKSKKTQHSNKEDLESYNFDIKYNFQKEYEFVYYENYNIKDSIKNKQGIAFNTGSKCWDLNIKLEKEIIPSSSISFKGITQKAIYLNIALNPFGGIKQKYKIKDN